MFGLPPRRDGSGHRSRPCWGGNRPTEPDAKFGVVGRPIGRRLPAGVDDAADLGRARTATAPTGNDEPAASLQMIKSSLQNYWFLGGRRGRFLLHLVEHGNRGDSDETNPISCRQKTSAPIRDHLAVIRQASRRLQLDATGSPRQRLSKAWLPAPARPASSCRGACRCGQSQSTSTRTAEALGYGFESLGNEPIRRIISSEFEIRAGRKIILIASSMSGSSAHTDSTTRSMAKPFEGGSREHLANQDPA
jgi:hypothetical protein